MEGGATRIIDNLQQVVRPDERLLRLFGIDVRHVAMRPARPWQLAGKGIYRDEWGIEYREASHYFEFHSHPLAHVREISELDKASWPDPEAPERYDGLFEEVSELFNNSDYAIMLGGFSESFFGMPSWLMGHENFYTQLLLNPQLVNALLDRLEEFFTRLALESLGKVGHLIHVVKVADDLGTQTAPILSEQLYRDIIKPRQKRLYHLIKEHTDAKIFLHSCGAVYPFIEDFIDCGVDVLNPLQVSASGMAPALLAEEFGDRLAFWGGGCDTQRILPFGEPAEVEEEVRRRLDVLARGGGYVFSAVHNIQYDVPPGNITALYDAASGYRPAGT
jgi:uroporphyrinogen decarboxylase